MTEPTQTETSVPFRPQNFEDLLVNVSAEEVIPRAEKKLIDYLSDDIYKEDVIDLREDLVAEFAAFEQEIVKAEAEVELFAMAGVGVIAVEGATTNVIFNSADNGDPKPQLASQARTDLVTGARRGPEPERPLGTSEYRRERIARLAANINAAPAEQAPPQSPKEVNEPVHTPKRRGYHSNRSMPFISREAKKSQETRRPKFSRKNKIIAGISTIAVSAVAIFSLGNLRGDDSDKVASRVEPIEVVAPSTSALEAPVSTTTTLAGPTLSEIDAAMQTPEFARMVQDPEVFDEFYKFAQGKSAEEVKFVLDLAVQDRLVNKVG